jgi:predicted porin
MKMKLIPAAILAAMSMVGAAQAQVSVYGLIDVGYQHKDGSDDLLNYSANSTTKFGIKGAGDLGSGIKGIFDLQAGGIASPGKDLAGQGFFDRNAYVGLTGGFGTVTVGIQDSVAFKTLIGFDLNGAANDTQASSLAGLNTLGQNGLIPGKGNTKELAQYSNTMGGFGVAVGITPTGDFKALNADPKGTGNVSLGLSYAVGGLAVGYAYEGASTNNTALIQNNAYSALGASYDLSVVKLSAILVNGGSGQRGSQVGLSVPFGGATFGVQYAKNTDTSDVGTEFFVNKEVLKNTTAYFEYGTKAPAAAGATKTNVYSAGLIYVF